LIKYSLPLALSLVFSHTKGQLQNSNWLFGYNAYLNFNQNTIQSLPNSQLYSNESAACVSHPETGQLLFYTNGLTVWNASHQVMPNGDNILGGYYTSSTQGALIVPFPSDNDKYYLFTLDELELEPNSMDNGLRYSVIDMALNNGTGDVVPQTKNTLLETDLTEKMIVIRSEEIKGYWVVAHRRQLNEFLAWKIDGCGISSQPVVSTVGSLFSIIPGIGANEGWAGAMDASPNGERIGMPVDFSNRIEFFSFDKATGAMSNPLTVFVTDDSTPPFLRKYGACFSPDGSKFYFSTFNSVYQLDLTTYTVPAIEASLTFIFSPMAQIPPYPPCLIQEAQNGKLYVAIGNSNQLDEISTPNAQGLACNYIPSGISITSGTCQLALPDFVPERNFSGETSQPILQINYNCVNQSVTAQVENVQADSIAWDFGDGNSLITAEDSVWHNYGNPVEDQYLITASWIEECLPVQLDSLLIFQPEGCFSGIDAPNFFSPDNGDEVNNQYFLNCKNIGYLKLTIFNRWGNILFMEESEDLINNNPSWDGKNAPEGVYFFLYEARDNQEEKLEGSGFLHLFR
jgi:gliding motility-associated-like protein